MRKFFLMLTVCLSAAAADASQTATVRFVSKKVQVQRESGAVPLKMGDKLSLNEKVSIEENGKIEIEYNGAVYASKKGGTVSEIIRGNSAGTAGFKDSNTTAAAGVRALDKDRTQKKKNHEDGGVLSRTASVFSK